MGTIPIYLQRLERAAEVIGNVKTDQLADPMPCAQFDVRRLINHFIHGVYVCAKAARGEGGRTDLLLLANPREKPPDYVGSAGDDAGAAVAGAVDDAKSAWGRMTEESLPAREDGLPANMLVFIALAEVVIHGWDIATATHQQYTITDDVAAMVLDGLRKQLGGGERPAGTPFASEVPVAGDATLQDQLVAFTGRTP